MEKSVKDIHADIRFEELHVNIFCSVYPVYHAENYLPVVVTVIEASFYSQLSVKSKINTERNW